jgi:hypothetical protein
VPSAGESTIKGLFSASKLTAPILLSFSNMPPSGNLLRASPPFLLVTWLAVACGGETFSEGVQPGEDSGVQAIPGVQAADSGTETGIPDSSDAGTASAEAGGSEDGGSEDGGSEDGSLDAGVGDGGTGVAEAGERDSGVKAADSGADTGTTDSGSKCVDFEPTPSDLACGSDQDCALVRSGEVCKGQCSCGDTPVNAGAAARFASDTAPLDLASCPCAFPGEARCLAGQCALCGPGSNQPAGCADAAAPPPGTDGGMCVNIDLSTYDQSCVLASDCIVILTGQVCSSECNCGGSPVNASEQRRYDEATSGIRFGECSCPVETAPSCVGNKCILPVAVPLNQ